MKSLIVIPTYNEIENIKQLITEVFQVASPTTDILVVDDNSPDGTGELVDALVEENERISIIHRSGKLGLGSAYVAGFKQAIEEGYDVIYEMDSDFSHHPKYLSDFERAIQDNDVVIGSRYISGGGIMHWGLMRKFISMGGSVYARFFLSAPIRDFTGGFNCWRREVLEAIDLDTIKSEGYSFQIEMKYRAFKKNYRIKEIPIVFEDRKLGNSKMSKNIVVEAMYRVLQMRCGEKIPDYSKVKQYLPFTKK